jgi:uncharacterized protein (TIGR03086 family)
VVVAGVDVAGRVLFGGDVVEGVGGLASGVVVGRRFDHSGEVVHAALAWIFKTRDRWRVEDRVMTDIPAQSAAEHAELPVFPTAAPATFRDPEAVNAMFDPVLSRLAEIVEVRTDALAAPTPCAAYDVADLRRHVLAWLQFFAAALTDPTGHAPRLDPNTWDLGDEAPGDIVRGAHRDIVDAARAGVAGELAVMSQARMAGDGVLAMALGEYLVHGWDLATATGRPYDETGDIAVAATAALDFLRTMVAPEHRGPDSGFFDDEVPAPPDATPLVALLCFAGRRPDWSPSST